MDSRTKKSEEIGLVEEGNKGSAETGALMLEDTEKKKSTRKKKSIDESKEEVYFSFTYNEENLKEEILENDLEKVKKKAGLLDDP
eukprot:gene13295-12125_t